MQVLRPFLNRVVCFLLNCWPLLVQVDLPPLRSMWPSSAGVLSLIMVTPGELLGQQATWAEYDHEQQLASIPSSASGQCCDCRPLFAAALLFVRVPCMVRVNWASLESTDRAVWEPAPALRFRIAVSLWQPCWGWVPTQGCSGGSSNSEVLRGTWGLGPWPGRLTASRLLFLPLSFHIDTPPGPQRAGGREIGLRAVGLLESLVGRNSHSALSPRGRRHRPGLSGHWREPVGSGASLLEHRWPAAARPGTDSPSGRADGLQVLTGVKGFIIQVE